MRFFEIIIDILQYLFEKIKALLAFFIQLIIAIFSKLFEKFSEIDVPEKIIFLNTVPAFFAVILPVASFRFPRLNMEWYVNNPLAVYMIGIVIIMIASLYVRWRFFPWIRIIINAYYLFWIIYIPLFKGFTAAPHTICAGYYFNIAVPLVYLLASFPGAFSTGDGFK